MEPASTISKSVQKAVDLVAQAGQYNGDRGRSLHRQLPQSQTDTIQRSRKSASESSQVTPQSPNRGFSRSAHNSGRPIHLLADSPPGSDRHVARIPSTKRHRGRRRSLQESLNSRVDTCNPPPVPEMPPGWQELINAVRRDKKGEPRTEHEEEARRNFEKLKKKRWEDLSAEEQAKEMRHHAENQKRLKAWNLDKDITRQTRKVEEADEEAELKARDAAKARRRLDRLKRRQGEQRPRGSPEASKRAMKLQESTGAPATKAGTSSDPTEHKHKDPVEESSAHQAVRSEQARNTPSSLKQVREGGNSQARPQTHRSSTAPTSAVSPRAESEATQRPSQDSRSRTDPTSAVTTKEDVAESHRISPTSQITTALSRPAQSEAPESMKPMSRIDVEGGGIAPNKVPSDGKSARSPAGTVAGQSTTRKVPQHSQLRQVSNANEVKTVSVRRTAVGQSQASREQESKVQKESERATKSRTLSQRPQTAQKPIAPEQKGQPEKKAMIEQSSQAKRTTRPPLTAINLQSASDRFLVESASAFDVQTELNRGPGDNLRTVIEGLVSMSNSDIEEEDGKRMDAAREALEEVERGELKKLLVTQFHRGLGDNMRTNLEGMQPMTSEDLRAEERNWKSRIKQQLEVKEEAEQAKLVRTEFNRELGNMMRYDLQHPEVLAIEAEREGRTNLEGMLPMTSEELKEGARERLEEEERRLQDELLRTRFNRGPGDNMRTVLEGMVSMSPESKNPQGTRKKKGARSHW